MTPNGQHTYLEPVKDDYKIDEKKTKAKKRLWSESKVGLNLDLSS